MATFTTFIWSDLHLSHNEMRLLQKRPFPSIEKMDEYLLQSWRDTVKPTDTIINLGDVSWDLNLNFKSLPGYKILIKGNHDRGKSDKWWQKIGFDEVYKYPIIYDKCFILSHEPVYVNSFMPYYVNVHGHTHTESMDNPQKINVSIEKIGYKPLNFDIIKLKFSSPENNLKKIKKGLNL